MIASSSPPPGPFQERSETLNIHAMWSGLVRNRYVAAGVVALFVGLAALVTWRATPIYESEATLRIDDESSPRMLLMELSPLSGMDRGRIATDMVVLRSRTLAERVVDSLALQLQLVQPAVARETVFSAARGADPRLEGTYTFSLRSDGTYTVTADEAGRGAPGQVRPGAPFRLGQLQLTLHPDAPERFRVKALPFRDAVTEVQRSLGVVRPNRDAKVVHVRYRSRDPQLVAAVPNTLAGVFMQATRAGSKAEASSTVEFLQDQVAHYQEQLRQAETDLRAFRESAQVVNLEAEGGEQIKQIAALRAERDAVATERNALGQLLARVRTDGSGGEEYRQLASFPTFLANRAVQDLLQTLTALENEQLSLLQRRTESNRDVRGIEERIRSLEENLYQMAVGYHQNLGNQITSLDANLGAFGAVLETLPAREIAFARLLRQQQLLEQIYTLLQTRLKESEIQMAVEPTDVRIIDDAVRPTRPVSPVPLLNLMLGMMLGILAAGGTVFAREMMNTRIRSDADVVAATHGLPVLGIIPRIRRSSSAPVVAAHGNGHGNGKGRRRLGSVARVQPEDLLEERLVMRRDPRSPVAEAYRSLRTNITFASNGSGPSVIMLTSAAPGDGKSTSASNLAVTLALQGTRVLLIDADLRRGVLHQIFGVKSEPGLAHALHLGTSLDQVIRSVPVSDDGATLDLLPAGISPPNPAELLGSRAMHNVLQAARERYDMIILDAPPVNVVTDASVLGTQVDIALLVARAGFTDRRALNHAMIQLRHLGVRIGGVVLNDSQRGTTGYYAYGYGSGTVAT